jgi:hypothetical protein
MQSIKRGFYDLGVQVRDLVSGTSAAAGLRFQRD